MKQARKTERSNAMRGGCERRVREFILYIKHKKYKMTHLKKIAGKIRILTDFTFERRFIIEEIKVTQPVGN